MGSKRTVVVVDDSLFTRERLCGLVTEAGGTVVVACNTLAKARTALEEHQPGLLLTDYCLNEGYGTDLAKDWNGPIIVVSGTMTPQNKAIIEKIAPQAVALDKDNRADILAAIGECLA